MMNSITKAYIQGTAPQAFSNCLDSNDFSK